MRRSMGAVTAILACSLVWGASTHQPPAKKKSSATARKKSSSKKGRSTGKFTPRQTQPDSARSREIQEALQKSGYLKTAPSGKWDKATSDAFARFQQAHGHRATGKPDAHSLQDMGLGPKYENLVQP